MLSKLDSKIRKLVDESRFEPQVWPDIENNPLVGYLRIFQNQHKVITILYRGLILAFSGFVILLSLLVYSVSQSEFIPFWGVWGLGIIDVFLIFAILKAFQELGKYRVKSTGLLNHIHECLKKDLNKLERIKLEHAFINDTHNKIRKQFQSLTDDSLQNRIEEYQGWDKKICPNCRASMEMSQITCPHCHRNLGEVFDN